MNKNIYNPLAFSFLVFNSIIILTSCSTAGKEITRQGGERIIEVFCSGPGYQTTHEFIRASGIGESLDQTLSRKKALTNTRAELAATLKVVLKEVSVNYLTSIEEDNDEKVIEKFQSMNMEVIDQELIGTRVICEKVTKTKDGTYKTYLAMELDGKKLLKSLTGKLVAEKLLREDNYNKYEQCFTLEIDKISQRQ